MLRDALRQLRAALAATLRMRIARMLGIEVVPCPLSGIGPHLAKLPAEDPGLSDQMLYPVEWPAQREDRYSAELMQDPLFKRWLNIEGGKKWTHYFEIYQTVFGARRTEPMRILEIGVANGGGLKLWREYFSHPETRITGVDIDPRCAQYDSPQQGIHVRIGSQDDADFLARIVREFGPFDLIIDDGSHNSTHILASFNLLFLDGLAEPGIYFVEDLHTNYWHDWRDSRRSFLDICYELVEHMHDHYRFGGPEQFLVTRPSLQPRVRLPVARVTRLIHEVRFFDSIVVLYKRRMPSMPVLIERNARLAEPAPQSPGEAQPAGSQQQLD